MDTVFHNIDKRGVATVTLNRPQKHNAFDDSMIAELTELFATLAGNPSVRVMVLRAEGRHFSAGGDLNWMQRVAGYSHEQNLQDAALLATMLKRLNTLPFPTIARIQGAAFGGGVGLASCCDIVVASEESTFSLSEVKIGLIPATISPYVIAAIGQRAARRFFNTAEKFSAQTATDLGLVSRAVATDELDDAVEDFVKLLLANSPAAITQSKQLIFEVAGRPIDKSLIDYSCNAIADIRASAEGREGLAAFLEKRKPDWIEE